MELEKLSGVELGHLVNTKQISPREVIHYFKDRAMKFNPSLNAFTYTMFDEALEEAEILEDKIMRGYDMGPFAGVPVGLKDFLDSKKGWKNSHGGVPSLIRTDQYDSEFYKAASSLGAIAVGKTNAPAFGFSGACQNKMYGATCNPFDLTRTSGGSSGGSASAVAGGLLTFAEAGDAGGSIRIPAAWCNLFGMKASLGTIPSVCRPDAWTATHPYCFNGCVTKTVTDSAIMLYSMAHYDPRDPMSSPINADKDWLRLMRKSIKGKKIALTYDFGSLYKGMIDPEVKQLITNAAKKFEEAGAIVDIVNFDFKHTLEEIAYCWAWSISVDTALDLDQWRKEGLDLVADHRDELPEEFIWFNDIAASATIWDMRKFNEIRTDILDNFENVFANFDVILSPITICKPFKHEDNGRCVESNGVKLDPSLNFISFGETPLANFVGYPAASIPAGLTSDNLPIGMQIIGKQYHDEDVFAFAKTFEEIQPWADNYKLSYMN